MGDQTSPLDRTEDVVLSPLVADLMAASIAQTQDVTNRLIDSLQHQLATEQATLAAINDRITQLCTGEYLPNPRAILAALYPSGDVIDRYRKQVES